MGVIGAALEVLRPARAELITDLGRFAQRPVAVASAAHARTVSGGDGASALDTLAGLLWAAEVTTRREAMTIPAVRRAVHVIAGTISTFGLAAWRGDVRQAEGTVAWLSQPDPSRTLQTSLRQVVEDLIWHDRAYWLATREAVRLEGGRVRLVGAGSAAEVQYLTRVSPGRITRQPRQDPDALPALLLDGRPIDRNALIEFDGAGLGGLERFGADLLELYMMLQAAAGRYAAAPHPKAILRNTGEDLDPDEIAALLAEWELARETRSVGYMNEALEYQTFGWNSQELQLTEAREHAALEVARLFGLPARALNAPSNDSMTYSNDVAARRDLLESLRPWMTVIEQTASLTDRTGTTSGVLVPRGLEVRFYVESYVRDDPTTRMNMWAVALTNGVLSLDEVRRQEPLAWTA